MPRLLPVVICILLGAELLARAQVTANPVEIQMGALPGLKFDLPRFAVAPGAEVHVKFRNPDQMIHNFVITAPGAREEVVMQALALGADGPAKGFIPDSPKVLWHTKALNPGDSDELRFTAPKVEGVYPYVCTFTGHGVVMYGAMYVTTKPLPPLETDPNLPPHTQAVNDSSDFSEKPLTRPIVSRTFLPDCGPAAIAVGFPGGQSYCFDAGLCRLRYAWNGGFIDNREHWLGKGEAMGRVVGHIYYRAPSFAPFRFGKIGHTPAARWRGYQFLHGVPEFTYTLDSVLVSERPRPASSGNGLQFEYEFAGVTEPVFYLIDPAGGASITSSAGSWNGAVLELSPEQARHFTITLQERPGVEPLRYWSMNDLVFPGKKDPEPGVVGRAFTPGGEGKPKKLDTGIKYSDLTARGATLITWAKKGPAAAARNVTEGAPLFTAGDVVLMEYPAVDSGEWHHIAVTLDGEKRVLFVDAVQSGEPPLVSAPAPDDTVTIGSIGEKVFFRGWMDEVRIYDRLLRPEEIAVIRQRDLEAGQP